ncbi:M28 family peptidase [Neobacillus niacini]|uniref:M28 family peptidase n=1 Tax=Neobacillus niacini TaxID=86668 RepID=UPI0021CB253E|nr:M28 family peptidase [Neobacillus niacini]MCM3764662.1 M28 family peptidase [Neobacillus niacini]
MKENLSSIEKEILLNINTSQLMEYNREIAKEIRLSGSEEELRAFQYAKNTLENYGLKTDLSFHNAYISLPGDAKLIAGNREISCITHSMAPSTDEGGLVGKPVYLGEYSPVQIQLNSGEIAVIEGIASPVVLKGLEAAGASGAIFINGPYTHEMIVSTIWGSPSEENIEQMPKIPVISINDKSGLELRQLINKGLDCVKIHANVETKWTLIPSLTAEIKGTEEPNHFVLFSGHIDSWHYGAMDNGSANAVMLESARVLSKYQHLLKRSIRFGFWSGHSHGRYAGSQNYADQHWEEIHENCVMHFYIDSVGGRGATIVSEADCMAETMDIGSLFIKHIADQEYIGKRYGKYADQSFWGAGVPSLFMGMSEQPLSDDPMSQKVFKVFKGKEAGGYGWWWHTVEDTIDKIDPAILKRDCEIYVLSLFKVLTDPILPINQLAAVEELSHHISRYQKTAGDKICLALTLQRLSQLNNLLTAFYENLPEHNSNEVRRKVNQSLMNLSRILVPLNYVSTDIFEHDPAVSFAPIPILASIYELSKLEKDTHEFNLLKTSINRKINKVNYLLKIALREAKQMVAIIKNERIVDVEI